MYKRQAHELDEQEGEEQGRQELQGGVLIIQDDVISTLAPARLRQVDVGAAGDPPYGLALESVSYTHLDVYKRQPLNLMDSHLANLT